MLLDRIDANPGLQNELHGNLLAINQLLIKSKEFLWKMKKFLKNWLIELLNLLHKFFSITNAT